jgi:hypothetical protein
MEVSDAKVRSRVQRLGKTVQPKRSIQYIPDFQSSNRDARRARKQGKPATLLLMSLLAGRFFALT